MKIQWSPLSIDRISEISEYIAQDSPNAAERWVHSIFDRVEQIKDFSDSGHPVPETNRKDIQQLFIANLPNHIPSGTQNDFNSDCQTLPTDSTG
ncbi:type II toxin-antitoxin system RelE/ParE family toxin [Pontiellaceae bacterium B12227]|nr:type II toxin-antitoxin system RelE/ParE family toxin [Pontiellaceae bacterium B12227]